jgi:hypothetical protein
MKLKRISGKQLESISRQLSDRDKAVLDSLLLARYLTSKQIQRLHFFNMANKASATVTANRVLTKLKDYGLIEHLERRIGGVRAGSSSFVWVLNDHGYKILHPGNQTRKRFYEPSPAFLEHTLATAEAYLQLTEICRDNGMELTKIEFEPKCWRGYTDTDSRPATLKPDLFAVTASVDYEDHYFIEIDLATEAPSVVLDKCQRYARYYRGGTEQKKSGVFPFVVWIVPSVSRKESLQRNIAGCKSLNPKSIFTVITPDRFSVLLTKGREAL